MRYIIYADQVALLEMGMNVSALYLVNCIHYGSVRLRRIFVGALAGTAVSLLLLSVRGVFLVRVLFGGMLGTLIMTNYVFRADSTAAFITVSEQVLLCAMLCGGGMTIFSKWMQIICGRMPGTLWSVLLVCGLSILAGKILVRRGSEKCSVIVKHNGKECRLVGLVDTGNGLIEPISGKSVSVVDKSVLADIVGEDSLFRAVPYHSIGCAKGILKGYSIDCLEVHIDGVVQRCENVYLAAAPEGITKDKGKEDVTEIIVHPNLLKGNL